MKPVIEQQQPNNLDSPPSPYLAFYGLAREPFAAAIEFDLFYPEATRIQRLDILHHLIQYGNELLLVSGPEGSGKSSLLQQFTARASNSWEIARIEAKDGLDERNLMQQFYSQFELNFHGATHPELLDQLQHHLDTLVHNSRIGVLLVDDAHQLTVTALQRILQLSTLKSFTDKPLLRVILFGEPELEQKLDDPLLARYADIPRRNTDLPPFNEEDSMHYILHRLSAARFVASEPFTESVLRKIYKRSQGWPGQLNALAHQKLLASLPTTEHPPELPGISDKALYKPQRLAAIGLISVILLAALFWNSVSDTPGHRTGDVAAEMDGLAPTDSARNRPAQPQHQQALAIPAPASETKASQPTPSPVPQATTAPAPAEIETKQQQKPQPPAAKTATKTTPSSATIKATAPTQTPLAANKPTSPPAPAKTTKPTTADKKGPHKKTTDAPISKQWHALPSWLPTHQNAWINGRNPEHYTLQLVAGERLETLQKFIKRHQLKRHLAFYQSQRKNKPWYALVYGEYPSKQAAIDARSQLPKKLHRIKPWVRNFADIQQSLK